MTLPGNSHSLVAACTPHLEARDLVAPCCKCHATYICLSYEGCVHIDTSVYPGKAGIGHADTKEVREDDCWKA